MKKKMLSLVFALLLPACALAVVEGVVEEAPPVEMEVAAAPEVSYLPDASYYAYDTWLPEWENDEEWTQSHTNDGEMYEDVYQNPRMTAGEAKRALRLLEAYKAGETAYTGESVLEKMENVVVGVYALNPDEYDGETVFTLLPGPQMTDEQLLAVIDAHAQLGLEFDPEKLSYRNCARGGGIETNRFFVEEERTRYEMMAKKIRRGIIATDAAYEGMLRNPTLDSAYFCGMSDFSIKPYRSMTDEELMSLLMSIGVKDETATTDFDGIERRSRDVLRRTVGTPLSMELSNVNIEGGYIPTLYNAECERGWAWDAEGRASYGATFTYHTADGVSAFANISFDMETDELVSASAMHSRDNEFPPEGDAVTQEGIAAACATAEKMIGLKGLDWRVLTDDLTSTNWGVCLPVRAQIAENYWMTVYIGTDDNQVRGMSVDHGTLVETLPEWKDGGNG